MILQDPNAALAQADQALANPIACVLIIVANLAVAIQYKKKTKAFYISLSTTRCYGEQEQQKLKGLELPIDLRVLSSTTIIDFLEAKMKEREKLELLK